MKVLLLTEANEIVASGHLFECIEIANSLLRHGYEVALLINSDIQPELKNRIGIEYEEYKPPIDKCISILIDYALRINVDCIVTNLREVDNEFIIKCKKEINERNNRKIPILCIDEFGNRFLECDAIINPMIDSKYWNYPNDTCLRFCGQDYLVLSDELVTYNRMKKHINDDLAMFVVSMGGVDIRGHALKLAYMLPRLFPKLKINIVCGGGFNKFDELCKLVSGNKRIVVHRNIDYLFDLFYNADLAFCAGGNTLHELAGIGTPAVVIPSMPHEVDNGRCFAQKGFGVCIENYLNYSIEDIRRATKMLENKVVRVNMSNCGKKIVDGKGKERIISILESML